MHIKNYLMPRASLLGNGRVQTWKQLFDPQASILDLKHSKAFSENSLKLEPWRGSQSSVPAAYWTLVHGDATHKWPTPDTQIQTPRVCV